MVDQFILLVAAEEDHVQELEQEVVDLVEVDKEVLQHLDQAVLLVEVVLLTLEAEVEVELGALEMVDQVCVF